jgi:MOSC domain-containing protein YiiM
MMLISVNIGLPRRITHEGREVSTGIFKQPVTGPVMLRRLNLDGDGQADLRVHGGEHKAVYVYPFEHYVFWTDETGCGDLVYGFFGENFTTSGLTEDAVFICDVFQIGGARVQVSQPRSPCFKLGIRMGDENFPARFTAANRVGFYLRVLQEGMVTAGDDIALIERPRDSISVRDAFRLRHGIGGTRDEYERAARIAALTPSWRAVFEKRLGESM